MQAFAVGQLCEFKFIIKRAAHDGQPFRVEWEELPENRRLQLGAEAPAELRLEMTWGSPRTLAWRRTCAPRPRSPLRSTEGAWGEWSGGSGQRRRSRSTRREGRVEAGGVTGNTGGEPSPRASSTDACPPVLPPADRRRGPCRTCPTFAPFTTSNHACPNQPSRAPQPPKPGPPRPPPFSQPAL